MLNKILKKYNIENNTLKLIVFGAILLILLVFIILMRGKHVKEEEVLIEVKTDELIALIEKIGNNYSLEIVEEINGNKKELYYDTDSNVELYDGSLIGDDGIMVYKNKKYILYKKDINDIEKAKLHDYKGDDSFVNDPYYNINLIKNIINYCELTQINKVKVNCKINLSDYISEYNKIYGKNIEINYDTKVSFDIIYYTDSIGKINIDYTDINKAINNSNDKIFYGIKLVSVDKNDFSTVIDYFKKSL